MCRIWRTRLYTRRDVHSIIIIARKMRKFSAVRVFLRIYTHRPTHINVAKVFRVRVLLVFRLCARAREYYPKESLFHLVPLGLFVCVHIFRSLGRVVIT